MLKVISVPTKNSFYNCHTVPIVCFCPVSYEPQQGSFIKISYKTKSVALDITTLASYIDFLKTSGIRDFEEVLKCIFDDTSALLDSDVAVMGYFKLNDGGIFESSIS